MEGRELAKGNPHQQNASRTQSRADAPSALERVRQAARRDRKMRFTALLHHVYDVARLRTAFLALKKDAAPGIDGETWQHYERDPGDEPPGPLGAAEARGVPSEAGSAGVHPEGRRAAAAARRARAGRQDRPAGHGRGAERHLRNRLPRVLLRIPAGAQPASRAGRALRRTPDEEGELGARCGHPWRSSTPSTTDGWCKFLEHRIADRRVVRLIQKWLNAGVLEEGTRTRVEEGTPQGGSVSPLLANIYLHYVFDLWVHAWRQKHARGDVIVVRYADDFVLGFQVKSDAERFRAELAERFAKFHLELHPEKTRLLEFGRIRGRTSAAAWLGKAGDVQLPRLHAHLREEEEQWTVHRAAAHDSQAAAGKVAGGQSRTAATHASPYPRARRVAAQRRRRAHSLLRRAHERRGAVHVPLPGGSALVPHASASEPAPSPLLDADAAASSIGGCRQHASVIPTLYGVLGVIP